MSTRSLPALIHSQTCAVPSAANDELHLLVRILRDATEASFLSLGLQATPQQDNAE
ncbi:MAG: hypothetical protein OJF49_004380 [Ktedonobacterales bacterium]|jgi:hypothetical protein|nr:MAG: hypothetical protein OJF49_004380 [Ktedonobacterales bacterium]